MFKAIKEFFLGKPVETKPTEVAAPYKVESPKPVVAQAPETATYTVDASLDAKPQTAKPAKKAAVKKPAEAKPVAAKKPAAPRKPRAKKTTA
jgi:hypothetical protein